MQKDLAQRFPLHAAGPRVQFIATVCDQIAHRAGLSPDALAVCDAQNSLTFRQLGDRSDWLAAQIQPHPSSIIPLFLPRSVDFVVAALAAMKCRRAYLPIDIATPIARCNTILGDCGSDCVITQSSLGIDFGSRQRILADALEATAFVADGPKPEDLAYVIYTSGSTGKPKGVQITHANLANLIAWHREAFSIVPTDRTSQVAGLGFDAAAWEIWPALAAGGSVHFADEATRRAPQLLQSWLLEQKINVSFAPTLMAEQLLQLTWPAKASLRYLLTGADTLTRRPPAGLPFKLVNNYGPTECTVVATSGIVEPTGEPTPSIGQPIGDTIALVLDEQLQPVADGVPGELCLAGSLVGAGYLNQPQLTAERFVHVCIVGAKVPVYRTGDQVRRQSDGQLLFLGRRDDQVKIRGYRVELGDVNACLAKVAGVEACAVIVSTMLPPDRRPPGDPVLIAYFVPYTGLNLSGEEISAQMATQLPSYMLPVHWVELDRLPTTANGKLDRAALPAPLQAPRSASAPAQGVHERIGSLVAELLGRPTVAPDVNFFMIGGHSMLGVQLAAKIRDQFNVRLTLRQLFKAPTIRALADEVTKAIAA